MPPAARSLALPLLLTLTGCPTATQILSAPGVSADLRFVQDNADSFVAGDATAGLSGTPAQTLAAIGGCWGHTLSSEGVTPPEGLPIGAVFGDGFTVIRIDGASGDFVFETLVVAGTAGLPNVEVAQTTRGRVEPLGDGAFDVVAEEFTVAIGGQAAPAPLEELDDLDFIFRFELVDAETALITVGDSESGLGAALVYQRFECR